MELDSDGDGHMDRFQYYEDEQVTRVESDTNLNGRIDTWEYYQKGQIVRLEGALLLQRRHLEAQGD